MHILNILPYVCWFTELVHVPNGFSDLLDNQLTTAMANVADGGRMLQIKYSNDANDVRFEAFRANALGHRDSGRTIYRTDKLPTGNELTVSIIGLSTDLYSVL